MKKISKVILLALLGSSLIIIACKKNDDHYTMNNQDFVTQASSSNMFEVAAGNLAQQKSTNADVKAFGNHMVTDHSQVGAEMATLANKKGWTVPANMQPAEQSNYNTLASLQGTAFDKQFAAMMVASHQQAISLFERASSRDGVPDSDLRGFASNKLPALREHLQGAQQLQTKVGQ